MKQKRKIFVISYYFPPISNAASNVISSIVKYFPKEDVCVLRGNPKETYGGVIADNEFKLDVLQYICDLPRIFRRKSFTISLPVYLDHLWIFAVVFRGLRIIKTNSVKSIFAMFPNHYFLIASYLIHKISGLPLVVYWVDVYQEGRPHFFQRWIAHIFERRILASAKNNFVMTSFLKDHFKNKYGIETEVLPIPTELKPYDVKVDSVSSKKDKYSIVFTGYIYDAQLDAVVNLVKALKSINQFKIQLLLVTPTRKENLEQHGVAGNNVLIFKASREECIALQRQADILFLPLAFYCPSPLVVKLSLPSEVLEYLSSGKPILVHAPLDSYIAQYAKEKKFAIVVDKPDPDELMKAVLCLLNERDIRDSVVKNARLTLSDHSAKRISQIIQKHLL